MTNYTTLEDTIVARIASENYTAAVMPDCESDLNRTPVKPSVYVSYASSTFASPDRTFLVTQMETITFEVVIRAMKRRGAGGIFSIIKEVGEKLQGYKALAGADRISLVNQNFIDDGSNAWNYIMAFNIIVPCVAIQEDPDAENADDNAYLLKQPEFVENQ